jgi:hypothetical protein
MNVRLFMPIAAVALVITTQAFAEDPAPARFRPVNVYIDSGSESLAAYQIEIKAGNGAPCAEIVGVEGGEHPAFRAAPYYDPAALHGGRIIIGALSTETNLPRGKARVAVLHVRETGPACRYEAHVLAAASDREERLSIQASLEPVNGVSDE